jgi:hypothetical protein
VVRSRPTVAVSRTQIADSGACRRGVLSLEPSVLAGSCYVRNGTGAGLYRIRSAIARATISASSPMPNRVEDFRFRKKCVPTK